MLFVFLTNWAAETVGDVIDISIKVSNRQSLVYDAKNCAPARRQQNRTPLPLQLFYCLPDIKSKEPDIENNEHRAQYNHAPGPAVSQITNYSFLISN